MLFLHELHAVMPNGKTPAAHRCAPVVASLGAANLAGWPSSVHGGAVWSVSHILKTPCCASERVTCDDGVNDG
jgi:hypothetical protein